MKTILALCFGWLIKSERHILIWNRKSILTLRRGIWELEDVCSVFIVSVFGLGGAYIREHGEIKQPWTHVRDQGSSSSLNTNRLCNLKLIISSLPVPVY